MAKRAQRLRGADARKKRMQADPLGRLALMQKKVRTRMGESVCRG